MLGIYPWSPKTNMATQNHTGLEGFFPLESRLYFGAFLVLYEVHWFQTIKVWKYALFFNLFHSYLGLSERRPHQILMIVHRFHYQSCPKLGGPILGAIWIPDWANCPNNFRRCPFTCWYHFEPSNISENRISCMTNWVQKQDLEQLCILAARSD